jgi:glycosyltransferase involved in cell wall biosynthesis
MFSSVCQETLEAIGHAGRPKIWVVRGSSHIRAQHTLLEEEEVRSGVPVERPSIWMIGREEREYAMADRIITLSSFARESFIGQGVPNDKVTLLLSAVDVTRFRANQETVRHRLSRLRDGQPLRVLTVGAFSMRKGAFDVLEIARCLCQSMTFRVVGDVLRDGSDLKEQASAIIEFIPRVPEVMLENHYAWADIFVFPTIEDGFPAVLAQALAAGLPVLATPNSSAPDIIRHGETGWILPIRSPSLFVEQLRWCDTHRTELATMVQRMHSAIRQRDWQDMASDLERVFASTNTKG